MRADTEVGFAMTEAKTMDGVEALAFDGVRKSFAGPVGEVRALNDISFCMQRGEFLAVQGPSGSGKTTLLLIAGGLLRPSSGNVRVCGQDPYSMDPNSRSCWRATTVGFVFQQFHLIPYLSVLDNVRAASIAAAGPADDGRAEELIAHLNLEHRKHHVPAQLSVGECQRAALARALLNRPRLILADEPTGNLDDANGNIVLDYLDEFADAGGSVLVVTHDQRLIERSRRCLKLETGDIRS
jgi:putative ABC transport system ATP-binding protein